MPATATARRAPTVNLQMVKRDQAFRFAECRAMGHTWRHRAPVGIDDPSPYRRPFGMSTGMVGFPSQCSNCHTERLRWITRSGETIVRYEHPDGYSRHGDERLTAGEWRRSYVSTIFEGFIQTENAS